jgi:hypothetical protein
MFKNDLMPLVPVTNARPNNSDVQAVGIDVGLSLFFRDATSANGEDMGNDVRFNVRKWNR